MEVTDLYTDLSDGKRLMKLLEVISKASFGKPNKGVLRVQKIENVGRALEFIKTKVILSCYIRALLIIFNVISFLCPLNLPLGSLFLILLPNVIPKDFFFCEI